MSNRLYCIGSGSIKCCKDCTPETGRSVIPNCHSYCERYLEERAELDRLNKETFDRKQTETLANDIKIQGIKRMQDTKHRRT